MIFISALLLAIIIIASIPAILGICLMLKIYRASRRVYSPVRIVSLEQFWDKPLVKEREKRRKPYKLEQSGLVSLDELASREIPLMENVGESWRRANKWDNIVKMMEENK